MFIQFALLVPLLTLFAMGIVEYGLNWKWANDANAAVRDAARSGTSEPTYLTSDRSVLMAIGTGLSSQQLDVVKKVVVFKATSANGVVPANCKSLTPSTGSPGSRVGQSGSCNVYGKSQIQYVLANPTVDGPWLNSAGTSCDTSDLDSFWCPAGRSRSLTSGSFDFLGVYIELEKPSTTNAGFGTQKISRTAVFRLEPSFGG